MLEILTNGSKLGNELLGSCHVDMKPLYFVAETSMAPKSSQLAPGLGRIGTNQIHENPNNVKVMFFSLRILATTWPRNIPKVSKISVSQAKSLCRLLNHLIVPLEEVGKDENGTKSLEIHDFAFSSQILSSQQSWMKLNYCSMLFLLIGVAYSTSQSLLRLNPKLQRNRMSATC